MNINFFYSIILLTLAQSLTYFQSQGQFFWPWAKNNPLLLSLLGVPISMLFIQYMKYSAISFEGATWPGRIISFGLGSIVFALLSTIFLGEGINTKTAVCLLLAFSILLIQIFWK
jgi:hypothetical protein